MVDSTCPASVASVSGGHPLVDEFGDAGEKGLPADQGLRSWLTRCGDTPSTAATSDPGRPQKSAALLAQRYLNVSPLHRLDHEPGSSPSRRQP